MVWREMLCSGVVINIIIDSSISWQINGSSLRLYPDVVDGFVWESNGTRVDTLTIPAIPQYNGTEVVCVANFFDGSPNEVTPPAHLIITGIHVLMALTDMIY